MTPEQFIALWQNNKLTERGGAQAHFDDLCELLGVEKPRDPDNYCFERGAKKASGGDGWADVWKRGYFAWENKKPGRDLKAALKQLTDYTLQLDNPPILVVCDREIIEIHTAFSGYPDHVRRILIQDLTDSAQLQTLRWVFTEPEKLRPIKSVAAITEDAAGKLGDIAEVMRSRGLPAQQVAHFLIQCLFCMFAEDEGLLPRKLFTTLLEKNLKNPDRVADRLQALFKAMQKGGDYGDDEIRWFNGGLFKTIEIPNLVEADIFGLHQAALMDWRAIDPSIFGTLFERGLDPKKRGQLGAHYTDRAAILRILNPVIVDPLRAEWHQACGAIKAHLAKSKKYGDKAYKDASKVFHTYLERLRNFRVLDPACGSGNFLYVALKLLKDLEHAANIDAQDCGLQRQVSIECSPANVLGIELDAYAAELARVTVWIGEIQWMLANGYALAENPILKNLDHIQNRDALIELSAENIESESVWPKCDVIVGNPPFLGGSKKSGELGRSYFDAINRLYDAHVPGGADLVCYWFHKAHKQIVARQAQRAGLVTTNSIRGGSNRKVLDAIVQDTQIFNAWSDEEWVNEGAAVRVSLICFAAEDEGLEDGAANQTYRKYLDGQFVTKINADLTAGGNDAVDLTQAQILIENNATSFQGSQKIGAFDISGELARQWLTQPNPNGYPNANILKPSWNGLDVTRRPRDGWIIDFGISMSEDEASLYEIPFRYTEEHVKPVRATNGDSIVRINWWRHGRPRPEMRAKLIEIPRYVATSALSKHLTFVWLPTSVLPDKALIVFARSDDTFFGIVHSRFHELWALRLGTSLEDRPRYTPTTTFATFPFPSGLTPAETVPCCAAEQLTQAVSELTEWRLPPLRDASRIAAATQIAQAAFKLNALRENWLNPADWVDWQQTDAEKKAGFPARAVAKAGFENELKKRTLTNLYNARPAWLAKAHEALDQAVALAYGWDDYNSAMSDEEILKRLLELNLQRTAC